MRLNFSQRGVGISNGVKGFRIGTGPRGPYVAGGGAGIYFRQSLRAHPPRASHSAPTAAHLMSGTQRPPPRRALPSIYPQQMPQAHPPQEQLPTYRPPVFAPPPSAYGPPPTREYRPYSAVTLAALTTAHALGWILSATDVGILLWLASMVAVALLDWHGFISLRGRIPWWRLSAAKKFWLVCAYVFAFEIMVPIYLVCAWIDYRRKRIADAQQRPFHIAQMEAELGMTPATEGTCAVCGKPLQAGAQFCSYCRAPVTPRPKVCLSCATLAQPDAQWCPKCGAALPAEP